MAGGGPRRRSAAARPGLRPVGLSPPARRQKAAQQPRQSEAGFQAAVIELAHLRGWTVAHFDRALVRQRGGVLRHVTPVRGDAAGWPDLTLVRGPRLIFRECKTDRGYPTPAQRRWGELLTGAGGDWALWRPRDWPEIEETLR
jgi:hypothetical protein